MQYEYELIFVSLPTIFKKKKSYLIVFIRVFGMCCLYYSQTNMPVESVYFRRRMMLWGSSLNVFVYRSPDDS